LELKNGLTTRTRICAEQGIDFEDILEEIKRERALMEGYGIKIEDIDKDMSLISEEAQMQEERKKWPFKLTQKA